MYTDGVRQRIGLPAVSKPVTLHDLGIDYLWDVQGNQHCQVCDSVPANYVCEMYVPQVKIGPLVRMWACQEHYQLILVMFTMNFRRTQT